MRRGVRRLTRRLIQSLDIARELYCVRVAIKAGQCVLMVLARSQIVHSPSYRNAPLLRIVRSTGQTRVGIASVILATVGVVSINAAACFWIVTCAQRQRWRLVR